jgi:ABC-2 type transport system ATP-binding protein
VLEVTGLHKSFGGKKALDGVEFSVREGEIFGLLGHNGAGKSTALGIILGMIAPDRGQVRIAGIDVAREHAWALGKVGAIFESPSFFDYLSGWQNLRILTGYSGGVDEETMRAVVADVGLSDRIRSRVGTYSHGMRQRLALAQALLPAPRLLLLDEPTDGLDPEGIKWFRDFILRLRAERGMTVLFNSHLLSEVEQMCDRVAIIRGGKLVYTGGVSDLRDEHLRIRLVAEPAGRVGEVVADLGGEEHAGNVWAFPLSVDPSAVVAALVGAGLAVREVTPLRRSLEELYLEISRRGTAAG